MLPTAPAGSHLNGFVTNDLAPLNKYRYTNMTIIVFRVLFDAHYLPSGAYEDFCAAGDLGTERHDQIQFGTGVEVVRNNEVDSTGGYVAGLSVTSISFHR